MSNKDFIKMGSCFAYLHCDQSKISSQSGFSYVEVLISVSVFAILTLCMAQFSSNAFNVMYKQGQQVEMTDQTRFSTDLIPGIINKAYYIFPAGKVINLTGTNLHTNQINTSSSLAFLISDNGSTPQYYFKAFYLADNTAGMSDLYQFSSSTKYSWDNNTCPVLNITTVSGTENLIATDIDKSQSTLTYLLNYNNGITDQILKGSISGITVDDDYALIKGINWNLSFNKAHVQVIQIEGVSNNVPRYL